MATYDKNEIINASDKNFENLRALLKEAFDKRNKGDGDSKITSFNKYNDITIPIVETQDEIIYTDPDAKRTINAMVGVMIDNINQENRNKIPTSEISPGDIIPSLNDLYIVVNDWNARGENNHGCNHACSGFCTGGSQNQGPATIGDPLPGLHGDQSWNSYPLKSPGTVKHDPAPTGSKYENSEPGCSGCTGDCIGACYDTCYNACASNCHGCSGCGSGCGSGCNGSCTGNCFECSGACSYSCSSNCESDCDHYCGKNTCKDGCTAGCTADCTQNCTTHCGSQCQGYCQYASNAN